MIIVLLLVLIIAILLLIILWLLRRLSAAGTGGTTGGGATTDGGGTTTGGGSQPSIPDQITGAGLAGYLSTRLMGTPADGSSPATGATPSRVIWVDAGCEVIVHLDSLTTQIASSCVLVSIDLETDQTGRTPLVVAFSLGQDQNGGLIAATDEFPRGNGTLAARWGVPLQQAAWNALLSLASDHAAERNASPVGLTIQNGNIQLQAGPSLQLV